MVAQSSYYVDICCMAHVGGEYRTQVCIFNIKERAYNTFHKPFHHAHSHRVKTKKVEHLDTHSSDQI